jgi:hypothetical protein
LKRRLRLLPGELSVCRLPAEQPTATVLPAAGWFALTRSADELSLVCDSAQVPAASTARQDGFRLLRVEGPLAFSEVGVLAGLAGPLAAAAVSIFVVSTFDTDYLLVRAGDLERACEALAVAGHLVLASQT